MLPVGADRNWLKPKGSHFDIRCVAKRARSGSVRGWIECVNGIELQGYVSIDLESQSDFVECFKRSVQIPSTGSDNLDGPRNVPGAKEMSRGQNVFLLPTTT